MIQSCCLKAINCETGTIVWINTGPEFATTYNTWVSELGNNFSTTSLSLPGTWLADSVCCLSSCPDYGTNCLNSIALSITTVTFGTAGCPVEGIQLTNCQDASTLIVDGIDPVYDGSVITIEEYTGCWTVSIVALAATETVTFLNAFGIDGCTCCLGDVYPPPPPPPPPPPSPPTILPELPIVPANTPASPRLFYQVTQGECDINANIKFANGYYKLFLGLKNGYGNCCDTIDLDKLWIKKEQSDYSVMTDPTACIITTPVVPVICPEPEGNPFVPPPVYLFIVAAPGPNPGSFGCVECFDGSSPNIDGKCPQFNLILNYNILDTVDPLYAYVFNYNNRCEWAIGFTIEAAPVINPDFPTYAMSSENITSVPLIGGPDPCTLCNG
jgi:hypothetical protein